MKRFSGTRFCVVGCVGISLATVTAFAGKITSIPQAKIVVDGKIADWETVKPLPVSRGKPCVKLAWAYEEGVYGLVQMEDADLQGNNECPYAADSIELFVESDNQKVAEADDSSCASQIVIGLPSSLKEGPAAVKVFYGEIGYTADEIRAVWVKTETGYRIEFQLPVKVFAPVEIEFERKLGFDFTINDNGKKVAVYENCVSDGAFRKPRQWGTIQLGK